MLDRQFCTPFVEVLTLPAVALFLRKDNGDASSTMAEWRTQEGMAARCRPWPAVLAADFEGSSPPSAWWPNAQKSRDRGGAGARAQPRRDPTARRSLEEVVSAAQEKVQKFELALKVLGEDSGPEFQVLQNSLKKAKAAAQGVPIGVQLELSLKFVERSEKRLQVLDGERTTEASLLKGAKQRVACLRSKLAAESPH